MALQKYYYSGNVNNPTYYTQDANTGLYLQINPTYTDLGNLGAIGSQAIQQGQVTALPQGATSIPLGGNYSSGATTLTNQGGSLVPQSSGQTTSAGGVNVPSPTITSPFSSSAGVDTYSQMLSMLQQAQGGNQSMYAGQLQNINQQLAAAQGYLGAQQTSTDLAFQQQIQQAQLAEQQSLGMTDVQAAIADPTGTYNAPTGQGGYASTAYQGVKAMISDQFQQTIGNIKDSQANYDAAMSANNLQAAAQAGSEGLQAAQNAINNNLGLMSAMFSTIENQQNYGLNLASFNQQTQYYQQQNNIAMANSILPQISGVGWGNLDQKTQNQVTQALANLGLPPGMGQVIANNNRAKSSTVVTDPLGNSTIVSLDGNGHVIGSQFVGGGISAGSPQGQSLLSGYVNFSPASNNQVGYLSPQDISGSGLKSSAILEAMSAAGKQVKFISNTDAQTMSNGNQALAGLNNMVDLINNVSNDLAKNSGQEVSGYVQRNSEQILNDPRISAWAAQNSDLISAIKASTGVTGGIGLNAVLGKTGSLIDTNSNVQTILQNAQNLASSIQSKMNVIVPNYMNVGALYPDLSAARGNFDAGQFMSGFNNAGGSSGSIGSFSLPSANAAGSGGSTTPFSGF